MPELLKNVLLVMNASGFLLPPTDERTEDQARLWTATFDRIQPFLPELQRESSAALCDQALWILQQRTDLGEGSLVGLSQANCSHPRRFPCRSPPRPLPRPLSPRLLRRRRRRRSRRQANLRSRRPSAYPRRTATLGSRLSKLRSGIRD